jgi:hypothetical protein
MQRKKRGLTSAAAFAAVALVSLYAILAGLPLHADATPRGIDYLTFNYWGGAWYDVEKSPTTPADDLLCWAATASNVLAYTGWGYVPGVSTADDMFAYYVNHWSNLGGMMDYAWEWWFSGVNDSQGFAGWSQVVTPGGQFYPNKDFWEYYHEDWNAANSMAAIDQFLHLGCGVGLALYGGGAHAVTCWGYNYDYQVGSYYGIWITDSDDDKNLISPPDRLRYYDVAYSTANNRWYIQDFYGSSNWYIGGVEALELIPEPASVLTLFVGLAGVAIRFRRR